MTDDGASLLYAATKPAVGVYRLDLNPDLRSPASSPGRLTEGSRNAFGPDLSPDGSSLVFQTGNGQQEDLFMQSLVGAPLVRLTNDVAKDRGPTFLPDGSHVLFYSDRAGPYELFVIPIDGSAARRITTSGLAATVAVWDPDGSRIVSTFGPLSDLVATVQIDADGPVDPVELNADLPDGAFQPYGWSLDGRRIVGQVRDSLTGVSRGIVTVDVASGAVEHLTDFGDYATWLSDSRHIAFTATDQLWIVDSQTRDSWPVLTVSPNLLVDFISASRGGPSIVYGMFSADGDLWLASRSE